MFELHPTFVDDVIKQIEDDGSKLGHVNALCSWKCPAMQIRYGSETNSETPKPEDDTSDSKGQVMDSR